MYDNFVVCNLELESLIHEQSILSRRLTALTTDEKQLYLMRGDKINALVNSMRSGRLANRSQRWLIPPVSSVYLN
jgi:hypothetical protein